MSWQTEVKKKKKKKTRGGGRGRRSGCKDPIAPEWYIIRTFPVLYKNMTDLCERFIEHQ